MEYLIMSSVKIFLKQNKMRVAAATYEALDKEIETMLLRACKRAEKNKRHTVMPQDL